jgi:hypothetical protein
MGENRLIAAGFSAEHPDERVGVAAGAAPPRMPILHCGGAIGFSIKFSRSLLLQNTRIEGIS